MVDLSCLQIPFICTWEDVMNFSKGLTFANKEAVKRALIINAIKDNRNFTIRGQPKLNCAQHALMSHASGTLGHS